MFKRLKTFLTTAFFLLTHVFCLSVSLTRDYTFGFSQVEPSGGLLRAQGWPADSLVQAQWGEQQRAEKGVKVIKDQPLPAWPPSSPRAPPWLQASPQVGLAARVGI